MSKAFSPQSWDRRRLEYVKQTQEEEVFYIESKEENFSLEGSGLLRREELEVLLGPEVFSRMIFLEDESKGLLPPIIFFDKGSVWRLKAERMEKMKFYLERILK